MLSLLEIAFAPRCNIFLLSCCRVQIPNGTIIIPNLASIHYDEKTYPDPYKFNPDRFIANANKDFQKPEKFMPFSAGLWLNLA